MAEVMEEEVVEGLLSPELAEALGEDAAQILAATKKTPKPKGEIRLAPEVIAAVKKQSRREKKREEQILLRKEKESKRESYLDVLKANALTSTQRDLLLSTRSIGQFESSKQRLTRLFKRHQAGLPLTAEEHELLFPDQQQQPSDPAAAGDHLFMPPPAPQQQQQQQEQQSIVAPQDASPMDGTVPADAAPEEAAPVPAVQQEQQPPLSKKAAKKAAAAAVAADSAFGFNMMAQFEKLKQKSADEQLNKHKQQHQEKDVEALVSDAAGGSASSSSAPAAPAYVAAEGELPIAPDGTIMRRKQAADGGATDPSAPQSGSSARGYMGSSGANGSNYIGSELHQIRSTIHRTQELQSKRMQLPICGMEQEIVECINGNDVVIICGETGSGKTTQVPQFLYESGYTMGGKQIVVTQPRRVAAMSTAERVAVEIGSPMWNAEGGDSGGSAKKSKKKTQAAVIPGIVGYQIRHDAAAIHPENTRIKFVTDGILLKEITTDLLLRQYSVIVLDEAHERNINTDILIGMLSRSILLRKKIAAEEKAVWETLSNEDREMYDAPLQPLKLVVMSATLRVDDFTQSQLFATEPPIIKVEARQYTVSTHFSRRTELENYLDAAFKKTVAIHRRLPPGGVLVFLTGKREIMVMCKCLNDALNGGRRRGRGSSRQVKPKDGKVAHKASEAGTSAAGDAPLFSGMDRAEEEANEDDNEEENQDGEENEEENESDSDTDSDADSDDEGGSGRHRTNHADDEIDDDDISLNSDRGAGEEGDEGYDSDAEVPMGNTYAGEMVTASGLALPAGLDNAAASGGDGDADDAALRDELLREALGFVTPATIKEEEVNPDGTASASTGAATAVSGSENTPAGEDQEDEGFVYKGAIVLPLHAMMSQQEQGKVFMPPKPGYRLIVVATNVAETSITIPEIKYVVDSGRVKEKVMDPITGVSKFTVNWVSKASAEQRKGRAGRVGPGHVYRLYSSAFFDQQLHLFSPPEIMQTPLEDLILQMKSIGIRDIERFPFPSVPPIRAMNKAIHLLMNIGALRDVAQATSSSNKEGQVGNDGNSAISNAFAFFQSNTVLSSTSIIKSNNITPLGRQLVQFPIHPRLSKILLKSYEVGRESMLRFGVVMVCMLSEKSPFVQVEAPAAVAASNKTNKKNKKRGKKGIEGAVSESESDEDDDEEVGAAVARSRGKGKGKREAEEDDEDDASKEKLDLNQHPAGDSLARMQGLFAYIYAISMAISGLMEGDSSTAKGGTFGNATLAVYLTNPKLRKWASEQSVVQVFCNRHNLHLPTLHRCIELLCQLIRICTTTASFTVWEGSRAVSTKCKLSAVELLTLLLDGHHARKSSTGSSRKEDSICAYPLAGVVGSMMPSMRGGTTAGSGSSSGAAGSKVSEVHQLQQVILAGYCDCIAKRAPVDLLKSAAPGGGAIASSASLVGGRGGGNTVSGIPAAGNFGSKTTSAVGGGPSQVVSRRRRLTGYISCNSIVNEVIYLHPQSVLFEKDVVVASTILPEYVVYNDLVSNQRGDMTYMTCNTVIEGKWIAQFTRESRLFHFTAALSSPAPYFADEADAVHCFMSPTFGSHNWPLAPIQLPMVELPTYCEHYVTNPAEGTNPSAPAAAVGLGLGLRTIDEPCRWFLRCLMEGQVTLLPPTPWIIGASAAEIKQITAASTRLQGVLQAAGNGSSSSSSGSKHSSTILILPSTNLITSMPPNKKFRDQLMDALQCLVENRIFNRERLFTVLLQQYREGLTKTSQNSMFGTQNIGPLVSKLCGFFHIDSRSEIRKFFHSLLGAIDVAVTATAASAASSAKENKAENAAKILESVQKNEHEQEQEDEQEQEEEEEEQVAGEEAVDAMLAAKVKKKQKKLKDGKLKKKKKKSFGQILEKDNADEGSSMVSSGAFSSFRSEFGLKPSNKSGSGKVGKKLVKKKRKTDPDPGEEAAGAVQKVKKIKSKHL